MPCGLVKRAANRFYQEAQSILEAKSIVIGITGSYGKTSTKAILGTILNV